MSRAAAEWEGSGRGGGKAVCSGCFFDARNLGAARDKTARHKTSRLSARGRVHELAPERKVRLAVMYYSWRIIKKSPEKKKKKYYSGGGGCISCKRSSSFALMNARDSLFIFRNNFYCLVWLFFFATESENGASVFVLMVRPSTSQSTALRIRHRRLAFSVLFHS